MATDFSLISTQDLSELIEEAVRDLLAGDAELAAFFTAFPIYADVYSIPADVAIPFCGIGTSLDAVVQSLTGGEGDRLISVDLLLCYDESRTERADGDRTIKAVAGRIRNRLWSDSTLSGQVGRLDRFEAIRWESLDVEPGFSTVLLQLRVTYETITDLETGALS